MCPEKFRAMPEAFDLSQSAAGQYLNLTGRDPDRRRRLQSTGAVVQKLEALNGILEPERAALVDRLRWAAYERER
jgi:hypothetical protein